MAKPKNTEDWHCEPTNHWPGTACSDADWKGYVYVSNDHQWIWGKTSNGGADWFLNTFSCSVSNVSNQTAPQGAQERIESNMLFNITVVKKSVSNVATNAIVEGEKILATDQVTAMEQNAAILAFGAKHADDLEGVSSDSLIVYIRQGA